MSGKKDGTGNMTSDSNAATLSQLERRLFGPSAEDVPSVFLQVLRRYVTVTATTLVNTHANPSRHSVCWLDGTLFGGLSCAAFGDTADPIIRGAVVPIRQLRLATIKVHDIEQDPVTGEATRWKRSTVFDLGRGEDLTFTATDTATLDTDEAGRFVDAVVLAMRQRQ